MHIRCWDIVYCIYIAISETRMLQKLRRTRRRYEWSYNPKNAPKLICIQRYIVWFLAQGPMLKSQKNTFFSNSTQPNWTQLWRPTTNTKRTMWNNFSLTQKKTTFVRAFLWCPIKMISFQLALKMETLHLRQYLCTSPLALKFMASSMQGMWRWH